MHYSSGYLGYRREVDPDLPIHDRQLSPHLFDDTEGRYLTAAEAGDVIAMVRLGSLLRHLGRDAEALPWLRRAAQAGDTTGMLALAELVGQLWTAEVIAHWPSPGDPIRLRRTYVTPGQPV